VSGRVGIGVCVYLCVVVGVRWLCVFVCLSMCILEHVCVSVFVFL
jgi:hypothetical protein